MRRIPLHAMLTVLLLVSGCAPIIIGSMMAQSSSTKASKQRFLSELQRTNSEREAQGLAPLDFCSQAYRFDRAWAMEDVKCAARIRRFEHGDSTALDPPGGILPSTASAVSDSVQRVYDEHDSIDVHRKDWMRGGR